MKANELLECKNMLKKKLSALETKSGEPCFGVQFTKNIQNVRLNEAEFKSTSSTQKLNMDQLFKFIFRKCEEEFDGAEEAAESAGLLFKEIQLLILALQKASQKLHESMRVFNEAGMKVFYRLVRGGKDVEFEKMLDGLLTLISEFGFPGKKIRSHLTE